VKTRTCGEQMISVYGIFFVLVCGSALDSFPMSLVV
jgi:hypothetical protein